MTGNAKGHLQGQKSAFRSVEAKALRDEWAFRKHLWCLEQRHQLLLAPFLQPPPLTQPPRGHVGLALLHLQPQFTLNNTHAFTPQGKSVQVPEQVKHFHASILLAMPFPLLPLANSCFKTPLWGPPSVALPRPAQSGFCGSLVESRPPPPGSSATISVTLPRPRIALETNRIGSFIYSTGMCWVPLPSR